MFAKVFTPLSNGEGEAVLAHGAGVGLLVWGSPKKADTLTGTGLHYMLPFILLDDVIRRNYFIRNWSTSAAIFRPLAMARTTSEAPLAASPRTRY